MPWSSKGAVSSRRSSWVLGTAARRHGGDVVLAAESRGMRVDWQSVRGRFLKHLPGGKGAGKRPPDDVWGDWADEQSEPRRRRA